MTMELASAVQTGRSVVMILVRVCSSHLSLVIVTRYNTDGWAGLGGGPPQTVCCQLGQVRLKYSYNALFFSYNFCCRHQVWPAHCWRK